jgi:hypothetical protein
MDSSIVQLIDKETAAFTVTANRRLAAEPPPFEQERQLLAAFRHTTETAFAANWAALLARAAVQPPAEGGDSLPDRDFYAREFHQSLHPTGSSPPHRHFSSVLEHFCDAWETMLLHKRTQWELAFIDALRREFLEELYQKIDALKKLQE